MIEIYSFDERLNLLIYLIWSLKHLIPESYCVVKIQKRRLTTWRRVLMFSIPSVLASTYLAVMFDVVLEMLIVFTAFFTLSAIMRK